MNRLLKLFCLALVILTLTSNCLAQDFTVISTTTDPYNGLIQPLKAGGSKQLLISLKNNRTDICTVAIDKSQWYSNESWVQVQNNNQSVLPGQTISFILTFIPPMGTPDERYDFTLYFIVKDNNNGDHSFYKTPTLKLIVDNTPPATPVVSVSSPTSTSLTVNFSSTDSRSIEYTNANFGSGILGIKSYTVVLKKTNNDIVESKSFNVNVANPTSSYRFNSLAGYTDYNAFVTAIDLADNSKTNLGLAAKTPPAKPAGLAFSNTTYIATTLQWNATAGATGYDVYNVATNAKVNTSPITTNSYTINNLNPNTNYSYFIIALSGVGSSDKSSNAAVKTIALPATSGSSFVCTTGATITVDNLIGGYTTSWESSSNLTKTSQSTASANYVANGNGEGWVKATIIAPTGQTLVLAQKNVWVGTPIVDEIVGPQHASNAQVAESYFASPDNVLACATYTWSVSPSYYTLSAGINYASIAFPCDGDYWVTLNSQNACGFANEVSLFVAVGVYEPYIITPNPATDYAAVSINESQTQTMQRTTSSQSTQKLDVSPSATYNVKVFNSMGVQVFSVRTKGKTVTIPTGNLKEGNYIVVVDDGKSSFKKQLLVKH